MTAGDVQHAAVLATGSIDSQADQSIRIPCRGGHVAKARGTRRFSRDVADCKQAKIAAHAGTSQRAGTVGAGQQHGLVLAELGQVSGQRRNL